MTTPPPYSTPYLTARTRRRAGGRSRTCTTRRRRNRSVVSTVKLNIRPFCSLAVVPQMVVRYRRPRCITYYACLRVYDDDRPPTLTHIIVTTTFVAGEKWGMTVFGLDEGGEEMRIEGGSETIKTCRFDSLLRELVASSNGLRGRRGHIRRGR